MRMLLALRLPFFSAPSTHPFFDSGANELRQWRQTRIEGTYDQTGTVAFRLAFELTGDRLVAEDLIVRAFRELGQETGVLAGNLQSRQIWLLRWIGQHAPEAQATGFNRRRSRNFIAAKPPESNRRLGRALYAILSKDHSRLAKPSTNP